MKNLKETIKKELRATIRDKKSLLMILVTPLLIPLFIFIFSYLYDDMLNNTKTSTYYIGINYELNDIEKQILKENHLQTKTFSSKSQLTKAFDNNNIHAYIIKKDNTYTIYSNPKSEDSSLAASIITNYLESYNNYLGQNYLNNINADLNSVYNNINYNFKEITGTNDLVNLIINFAFIFSIMSITLTAIYGATDTTAGEKERGTLETFLTFPIKNTELITGKYLAITISCIITSIISTILAITSLTICHNIYNIYKDTIFNFTPWTISLILIIMISYSLFISGLAIAIASFSKTYKEAQSSLTPLSFLVMIPMFFNILEIKISPILSIIPIVNHTLLINDIILGKINPINIIIMFISTIIYIIILIKFLTKLYKSEKILFSI